MSDKQNEEYWNRIEPGSIVTLDDSQAIEDSMKKGAGVKGIDYDVKSIRTIRHETGLCTWIMLELGGEEQDIWLMIKIVDADIDVRAYFEVPEFPSGDRADILERGCEWVFVEPEDANDFDLAELEFAQEITQSVAIKEGESEEVTFSIKEQGVLFGEATHCPELEGVEDVMFIAVAEYITETECENPELLILEMGGQDSERGGFITLMLGAPVNFSEIEVMNVKGEKNV